MVPPPATKKTKKKTKKKTTKPAKQAASPAKRGPGRPWTPEGRRLVIPIRVNDMERDLLRAASKGSDTSVATMVREVAIEHARRLLSRRG
jgi:hypothetical protein